MAIYFLMLIIPAIFAINNNQRYNSTILWFLILIIYSFIIGFRDVIGADWFTYARHFTNIDSLSFYEVLIGRDPGYYIINYIFNQLNLDIYYVNMVCGILFMLGLLKLVREELNPWVALSVAVPYTIIVVAMGYSRQAVALAFVMWAITYLRKNQMFKFILLIIIASSFHKSAVIMIGLGIFSSGGSTFFKIIAISSMGLGLYNIFLASYVDTLTYNYIEKNQVSSGAFIRTFMNLIPAIILIIFRRKWKKYFDDFNFWIIIALLSIICFFIVGIASTAVDRLALYLIPLQIVVFSRLGIILKDNFNSGYINIVIIIYYTSVQFVWLNFANNAQYWLPYKNILFKDLY